MCCNLAVEEAGRRSTLPTGERVEPTWLDLANELQERAYREFMSRPSLPREETPWTLLGTASWVSGSRPCELLKRCGFVGLRL